MDKLYKDISYGSSRLVTRHYSTSFSMGIRCFHPRIRDAVYAIYGFVRLADEIVDTFHDFDRNVIFNEFEKEYRLSLERGISTNPVINAFQNTVHTYGIDLELVDAFLRSMRCDLGAIGYGQKEFEEYIYGSAEVVGLMCLKVFVQGNRQEYDKLLPYARRLGAAFQKINFLRDLRHDANELHRRYFPSLEAERLNERNKRLILDDIYEDFKVARKGIDMLPSCARMGVYTAYLYYKALTRRIDGITARQLMEKRVRISNGRKFVLLGQAYLTTRLSSHANTR